MSFFINIFVRTLKCIKLSPCALADADPGAELFELGPVEHLDAGPDLLLVKVIDDQLRQHAVVIPCLFAHLHLQPVVDGLFCGDSVVKVCSIT